MMARNAECCSAECHYAECRFAECRGAVPTPYGIACLMTSHDEIQASLDTALPYLLLK